MATAANKPRKIGILGTSKSTLPLAPLQDESWEFWTLGQNWQLLYNTPGNITRHFEMHDLNEGWARWRTPHKTFLSDTQTPVYLQALDPEKCPAGVEYPLDAVMESVNSDYFTCTISYMLAIAIHEHVDELGIWGCDLEQSSAVHDEYKWQRPSVEYFLGMAQGMGIKVHTPKEGSLCKTMSMYAYQTHGGKDSSKELLMLDRKEVELRTRLAEYEQQHQQHANEISTINMQANHLKGALEMATYMRRYHTTGILPDAPQDNNGVESNGSNGSGVAGAGQSGGGRSDPQPVHQGSK